MRQKPCWRIWDGLERSKEGKLLLSIGKTRLECTRTLGQQEAPRFTFLCIYSHHDCAKLVIAQHSTAQHSKHGMSDGVHTRFGKARKHWIGFRLYRLFLIPPLQRYVIGKLLRFTIFVHSTYSQPTTRLGASSLTDVNVEIILCVDRLFRKTEN